MAEDRSRAQRRRKKKRIQKKTQERYDPRQPMEEMRLEEATIELQEEDGEEVTDEDIARLEKIARFGDLKAQVALATWYDENEELEKAFIWYEKAAQRGEHSSEYRLGEMYLEGEGTKKNIKKGMEWIRKAAKSGDPEYQFALGNIYLNNKYGQGDDQKAFEWHKKAAEQNHTGALQCLGVMYTCGIYTRTDIQKAIRLFEASARLGNPFALYSLGSIYFFGYDVKKDFRKALRYYIEAYKNRANRDFSVKKHVCKFIVELIDDNKIKICIGGAILAYVLFWMD